jgi:hypothetical protein
MITDGGKLFNRRLSGRVKGHAFAAEVDSRAKLGALAAVETEGLTTVSISGSIVA